MSVHRRVNADMTMPAIAEIFIGLIRLGQYGLSRFQPGLHHPLIRYGGFKLGLKGC